ncbi:MAG: hypothetical protein LAT52_12025 [Balneolales bacterium]|nr:hypothetical protein [Balneolales bacterium]
MAQHDLKTLELIQWLSTIDNPSIIEKVLAIRNSEKEAFWERLSATEKESINKGIKMLMTVNSMTTMKPERYMASGYKILWTES